MGKLRFDGVNDIVQVPNAAPFTAGMAYVFEWEGTINAFPSSGLTGIIGTITGSNSNGVVMHASEGSGVAGFMRLALQYMALGLDLFKLALIMYTGLSMMFQAVAASIDGSATVLQFHQVLILVAVAFKN